MTDNELFGNSEQLNDKISRQAALNIAHKLIIPGKEFHQNNQAIGNYMAELVKLPSAQPVAKDINVPAKDCISRQWLMECVEEGWIKFDTEKDENRFVHLIRDIVPSAQPTDAEIQKMQDI